MLYSPVRNVCGSRKATNTSIANICTFVAWLRVAGLRPTTLTVAWTVHT